MLEVQGHRVFVLLDRSGSMDERDCEGQTRYDYTQEKLRAFVPEAAKVAADNTIHFIFFNSGTHEADLATANDVQNAMSKYRPGGSTGTDQALEKAWKRHSATPGTPSLVFLVTDGHPDSESAVDQEIIGITKKMTKPEDFRIMLLTVGQRDDHLKAWLDHLDEDLGPSGAKFDIVGQNDLTEVNFQEAAAELIASTTTNAEDASGHDEGKKTTRVD